MKISAFISPEDISIKFRASSKKQVLEEMVRLAGDRIEGLDRRSVVDLLNERERLGCTGIGNGVAIPHTRCALPAAQTSPVALLALLEQPVDFDANDDVPVDIVFMLLAPESSGGEHLAVLALASRLLSSRDTAEALRRATSRQQAWEVLAGSGDPSKTAA